MLTSVAAATAATVAVLLWRPPQGWLTRRRLGIAVQSQPSWRLAIPVVLIGFVVIGDRLVARPAWVMLTVATAGVAWFVVRYVRHDRARHRRLTAREDTTEVVALLAAELRAGVLGSHAVSSVARDFPVLASVARTARLGGSVPDALRDVAGAPGREAFAGLAGAWQVAERSGAPLAQVLDRLAIAARDDAELNREVQAGVEPARASGRLMAVLPLLGLALGAGLGADPVAVVTESLVGASSVAAGLALACAGVTWIERIARRAEVL